MKLTPEKQKWLLNLYPPYLGAGVRVEHISDNWQESVVSMKLRWFNRNAVGTHFGGSLYSMLDPHLMLMLMQILGKGYLVWDKAAEINFIKPGRGKVSAHIQISDKQIQDIQQHTADGQKYLPEFTLQVFDDDGTLVSECKKTLYVKKKPAKQ